MSLSLRLICVYFITDKKDQTEVHGKEIPNVCKTFKTLFCVLTMQIKEKEGLVVNTEYISEDYPL